MSSNTIESSNKAKLQKSLTDKISSLAKAGNIIVPFAKEHFSCPSLAKAPNIHFFDLSDYSLIEDYNSEDQIITLQCGIKVKELQSFLSAQNKWFPVSHYDDDTSLLDIILSAETGPFDQLFGGLSRHILGLDSVIASGDIVKSGGKVVKNVSGYDLTRFLIGSYGYFAIPIRAHLRLYALPMQKTTIIIHSNKPEPLLTKARKLLADNISFTYLQLFDQRLFKINEIGSTIDQWTLALQIYGNQQEILAAQKLINDILGGCYSVIDESQKQEQIIEGLSQMNWFTSKTASLIEKRKYVVDVAVQSDDIVLNMAFDTDFQPFPFVYKVTSKQMRFCLNSLTEQDAFLDLLKTFTSVKHYNLITAYADEDYIRTVRHLGYDHNNDHALKLIKTRLKSQFDPDNRFNPFVDL